MADVVYELVAKLGLDSSGLEQGLDEAEDTVSSSGILKTVGKVGLGVAAGVAAVGAGIASVVKTTVTAGAQYADTFLTMSAVTGMATEDLQTWAYAAELIDVPLDTITGSTTRLIRTMNSARNGTESAATAFERLGISVEGEDGTLRDANDVFLEVIDALSMIDSETERDAIAMELFGRSARDLNPLIKAGSGVLAQYRQEAEDMNYILEGDALQTLGSLDDAFQRLANARTMILNRVGLSMAPAIERVIDKLIQLAERIDWEAVGDGLARIVEALADVAIKFVDSGQLMDTIDRIIDFASGKISFRELFGPRETENPYVAAASAAEEVTDEQSALRAYARLQALIQALNHAENLGDQDAVYNAAAVKHARDQLLNGEYGDYIFSQTDTDEFEELIDSYSKMAEDLVAAGGQWGEDLAASMTEGLSNGAPAWEAANMALASISERILGHSEPDIGPMAHDSQWMPDLMRSMAEGIEQNKHLVTDAMTGLAGDMRSTMSGGIGTPVGGGVNITINVDGGLDSADTIAERISNELSALFGREAAAYA